ncbi:MAG: alpha/beta fold hydrolase [Actinomycetota bacterium]
MTESIVAQEPVRFSTADGVSLEGEVRRPADGPARGGAVLCHPHPREGGSKDHPLLWALRSDLSRRGFAVLSFNFRGVMGSSGTYGGGHAELQDARAAIDRVRTETDGGTLLVGWSFGANVALRLAVDDTRIAGLAAIGLPLGTRRVRLPPLPDPPALRGLRAPVLLLAGEHDIFCPSDELRALGAQLRDARVEITPGTDHYYWRREPIAADQVGAFASTVVLSD